MVAPGESLWSIAAADGLSVDQLAAANGLSPNAELIAGATIMIPPVTSGVLTPSTATSSGTGTGYVVQPGDTLSAIAARAGTTVAQLAADNGLNPNGLLLAGVVIHLPEGGNVSGVSGSRAATGQPVSAAEGSSSGPPYPTPQTVSASEVGQIAGANGVPPSLAEAIGWQESGFNNDVVSSAGAVGVMQILPGTWDWINRTLVAGTALAPADAASNVAGGVLLLRELLDSTGDNAALAAGGYYQGLSSVQRYGLFPSTQQYVNDVMALAQRFGGG